MKKIFTSFLICLLAGVFAFAQEAGLEKKVSLNYQNVLLGNALEAISHDYNVYFSYSKDFIPVGEQVNVSVYNQPLSKALDELLAPTQVVYAPIGDQIVLRVNDTKPVIKKKEEEWIGSVEEIPSTSTIEVYTSSKPIAKKTLPKVNKTIPVRPTPLMRTPDLQQVEWTDDMLILDKDALVVIPYELPIEEDYQRIAQLSVLPDVGTNLGKSKEITNNVSVNVLWGKNGGVNGVEVGGLVNTITGDVKGAQVAGIANKVQGDLGGTDLLKNNGKKRRAGLQVAGIANVAGSVKGAQFSGIYNRVSKGNLQGTQVAGIGNKVVGSAEGWQVSGIFNTNEGDAGFQVAGIVNNARDVSKGQVAGIVNIARKVEGFQIGLINISDSINGTPIGLLNFVKHGFNRLEISRSETFDLTLGIKFGAPSFYNILEVNTVEITGERSIFNHTPHWALSYGIGTSMRHKKKLSFQLEAVASQVNEGSVWTRPLNMLGQLRLVGNLRLANHFNLYGGPSINVFVSNLYNTETQEFESQMFRAQSITDRVRLGAKPQRVETWVGYKFGIRF